jgi:hypothetical protein
VTYTIEVMLRETHRVVSKEMTHPGGDPECWTDDDVRQVVRAMLLALDAVSHPGAEVEPDITLRGISWIVSPYRDGVAIAMEIFSGSIVAGPFKMSEARLNQLLTRVMAGEKQRSETIH